jgi:hypothetical protein
VSLLENGSQGVSYSILSIYVGVGQKDKPLLKSVICGNDNFSLDKLITYLL